MLIKPRDIAQQQFPIQSKLAHLGALAPLEFDSAIQTLEILRLPNKVSKN
jgi:hypothetical protein